MGSNPIKDLRTSRPSWVFLWALFLPGSPGLKAGPGGGPFVLHRESQALTSTYFNVPSQRPRAGRLKRRLGVGWWAGGLRGVRVQEGPGERQTIRMDFRRRSALWPATPRTACTCAGTCGSKDVFNQHLAAPKQPLLLELMRNWPWGITYGPILGWMNMCHLFGCSPGVQGFDPQPTEFS